MYSVTNSFGLKMGVDGVAWPSVVSRVIAAVLILGRCYQKGHALTVPKTVKLDTGMAKRILGIGVPSAFENSLFEAGRIVVVSMISTFGTVQIDIPNLSIHLDVSDEELAKRKANWTPREPKVTTGYLARYAAMVTSGNRGAILEVPKAK